MRARPRSSHPSARRVVNGTTLAASVALLACNEMFGFGGGTLVEDESAGDDGRDPACMAQAAELEGVRLAVHSQHVGADADVAVRLGLEQSVPGGQVALADVTLRYWYTSEGQPFTWSADMLASALRAGDSHVVRAAYATRADGQEHVVFSFVSELVLGEQSAEELSFVARLLPSGGFDPRDDWSFEAGDVFAPNPRVTAYWRGCLIWGMEP